MQAVIGRRSVGLILLAAALALVGLAATYVKQELADPQRFADHAVDALEPREVREAIAEQVAVAMIERGSPDLVASRPLVLAAVEAVLETDQFARLLRRAAITAHEVLIEGNGDAVVELEQASEVLVPAVESVSPEVAREIPTELSPRIAEIRRGDAATWAVRVAEGAGGAALPLLIAAALTAVLAVALAPDRRRAVAVTGGALAGAAGLGLAAMAALRVQVVSHAEQVGVLSDDDARAAAGAAWDALAGGLDRWLVVMGVAGLALVGGAVLDEARVDRRAALSHAAEIVVGGSLPRPVRLLRGLGLAVLGGLILVGAQPLLTGVILVVGAALLLFGLAEAISTAGHPARVVRPEPWWRRRTAVVGGAVTLAAAGVTVLLIRGGGPPAPPAEDEIRACNGQRVLCDRRLDEVVLPGTHNSMSAADRPGWFFANQIRPIPRQLRDGIRLLMIDPHYGIVDAQGRVRTDLSAEGTDRNRVARRLGPEAVGVAERLAGRLDLVPSEGEREIFLCHTLCELGAERMGSALDEIRGFLERHPAEVLVLFLESSVDPSEVQHEFEKADIEPYLATLDPERPLPTLREMIASGRRLVVLDQGDGGDAPWYHSGFLFLQDTRIDSLLASHTACEPGRGTPDNPLLLLNHWINRFPPPLTANRRVEDRRTLLRRVRSCRRRLGRTPNLIAVDFYQQGDLIATARELNLRGPAANKPG
jgi:hypothetical protein